MTLLFQLGNTCPKRTATNHAVRKSVDAVRFVHKWRFNCFITLCGLLMLWLGSDVLFAAESAAIKVEISSEEIYVGDSVDYYVDVQNVKNPAAPDMSAIKQQFDVVAAGDRSHNETSITVSNGKMSKQNIFRHVYQFKLTPKSTGDLTIPPVTVTVDGKTITSNELSLHVIEAEKQDLVRIEIKTNPQHVYPTQPFTVTVRIFVHPLPSGMNDDDPLAPVRTQPPHLQINWLETPAGLTTEEYATWLQPLVSKDGVGFTINELAAKTNPFFDTSRAFVFDLSKGREIREDSTGETIRYFVYELSRTFTPERTGEYIFGPAIVKGVFVSGVEKRKAVGRRLVAIAPATTVEVSEVPSPRPATFCGGIGEYKVTASAHPIKLRVGDPLTLTLEFRRGPQSGSLDLISAPDLSAIPQLVDDFDLVDKNPTGRVEGTTKKFAYALRPKRANVEIPSVDVSTFDPQTEDFVDVQTPPILLEVTEAARMTAGEVVGTMPSSSNPTIKTRAQGIFQNITDPSELKDERVDPLLWGEIAGGAWIFAACLIAVVTGYRRKSSDAGWMRKQQAKKAANRKLTEVRSLVAAGDSKQALGLVRSAIIGFVADTKNWIAEGLTSADISAALSAASVPDEDRLAVERLLESIESTEYGGGQSADAKSVIDTAGRLISRIQPYLERSA